MSKKVTKKIKKQPKLSPLSLYFVIAFCGALIITLGLVGMVNIPAPQQNNTTENSDTTPEPTYTLSEDPVPAIIEDDKGELIEVEQIPTMEEVDGGKFEDKDTGVSVVEGEYADLGWSETFDVTSPEAFKNDTLNRCIIANNYYGAQCVSLARVFWWSYADRDVSTCGTGMAKGMMNCAKENAGDDFIVFNENAKDEIQAGDWLVFTGGQYGHIGMSLGPVHNGYVTLLGENQGGKPCDGGGSATNIININIKNLIGFYRPKAYVKPVPTAPDTGVLNNCK